MRCFSPSPSPSLFYIDTGLRCDAFSPRDVHEVEDGQGAPAAPEGAQAEARPQAEQVDDRERAAAPDKAAVSADFLTRTP